MKLFIYNLILFIATATATGQKTEYFEFSPPTKASSYSAFDKVEFADNRMIKEYVGVAPTKNNEKLVPIWLHAELSTEIASLIDTAIQNVPKEPHTILINLRNFFINETSGLFEFHAECYAKWDEEYWLVYRIDSSYKEERHITRNQVRQLVNEVVQKFISTIVHLDLSKRAKVIPVTIAYINAIDVNEKKELPAFNLRLPATGVYYTYEEFKNNRPRLTEFDFKKTNKELKLVSRLSVSNVLPERIPRDSLFAVCDGEELWIAAANEYAKLNKRGLDFFFRATAYENNKIEEIALATYYFGIGGGLIAAIPRKAMFEFRLNHINGKFILLRRSED